MAARVHLIVFIVLVSTLSVLLAVAPVTAASSTTSVKLSIFRPSGLHSRPALFATATGKILHTADGGQIFGFDINQNGTDGVLGSAQDISSSEVLASLETFNQSTLTITKTVVTTKTQDDWVADGIFFHDVGLVQHDHVVGLKNTRSWKLLNPVTGNTFTGSWTPPGTPNFLLDKIAQNQATKTAAVLGEDTTGHLMVFSSNIGANTFGPVFHIDPSIFSSTQIAEDTVTNEAILATSPDGGAVGGAVPLIAKLNLSTGSITEFNGIRIGIFHSGFVNGLAVDSATGIACTTTELDAAVEFYDLKTDMGIFVAALPGSGLNQGVTGEAVVNDPIHKLFLVVQPTGSIGPPGSAIIVFDEQGNFVEAITGFLAAGVTPGIAINPSKRLGYVLGPTPDALLQFSY